MRQTEKKLFVILFALAWIIAGALWLVMPDRQPNNTAQEPTVTAGLTGFPTNTPTPTLAPDTFPVQVKIVAVNANKAEVRLVLAQSTTISGAELFLKLPSTATLSQSACGSEFSCPRIMVREDVLTVSALRPLRKADQRLQGDILVATLTFGSLPASPWTINTRYSNASQVLGTDGSQNLLTPYQTELTLQQR